MKRLFLLPVLGLSLSASAQQLDSAITLSAYAEAYYSFDLAQPDDHLRPGFVYSHNRHNEVNLNLGMIKLAYAKDNVRGNLALMAGTYPQYNLAAEPELLRSVFEANVGVKLSKTRNLWLDAGIMPSHIGFESAIGKDCWNLTRSMLADNTPYYEAGARVSWTSKNEKWYASGLLLNGWQRIARVDGNNTPAFGTQLTYKPNGKTTLNWSTFIGNDKPDTVSQSRIFNNLYAQLQLTERFGVIVGCDIGMEQAASGDSSSTWVTPILIPRYKLGEKSYLAARVEYYQDEKGVIIATGTPNGFTTLGYSLNFDRWVSPNVLWRIEARSLNSEDKIFVDADGKATTSNTFFTASICHHLAVIASDGTNLLLQPTSPRGRLKVYIGMSAGVGKSYRMLEEAHETARPGGEHPGRLHRNAQPHGDARIARWITGDPTPGGVLQRQAAGRVRPERDLVAPSFMGGRG